MRVEMKLIGKIFAGALMFTIGLSHFGLANSHHPEDHFSHLTPGGRRALHGMVVFGSGPYFLEHIPMLTPPHDFQIITEVVLKNKNGIRLNSDFSSQGFTLKPSSSFPLNDYVAGRLKVFTASIHQGNFEQGGKVVPGLENVKVEIQSYQLIRQLPATSQQQWIQVTDGKNIVSAS